MSQEIVYVKHFITVGRKLLPAACVWVGETWCSRCLETAAHFPNSDSNLQQILRSNAGHIKWNIMVF